MKIKTKPKQIWGEYESGKAFKDAIKLYENVKRNNNFYNDKQWEGVQAPTIDKPVFNVLKPVVNYYVAMLISDDVAVNVDLLASVNAARKLDDVMQLEKRQSVLDREVPPMEYAALGMPQPDMGMPMQETVVADGKTELHQIPVEYSVDTAVPKIISHEVANVIEQAKVKGKNREAIRNCAVDGDACFYVWFDPDAYTGFDYEGDIKVDVVDNTNVYFGNPSVAEVEEQPYIILVYRRLLGEVRAEARANGMSKAEVEQIKPDDADTRNRMNANKDKENKYVTVLLKLWKEAAPGQDKKTVHFMKCTQNAVVQEMANTGYRLYPVCWMSWEREKNSYHGVAPLTGKIPNQVFINKIYTLAMLATQNIAFPKVLYDETKIDRWDPNPGKAIATQGPPDQSMISMLPAQHMSADVLNMAGSVMQETKNLMGASDAALGNVKPDNTSAIIATQKAAGMPLDKQKLDFHDFVESYVRIIVDVMRENYGERYVQVKDNDGNTLMGTFDFASLGDYVMNLNIDVGTGSYWSELMQVQTLDSLLTNGILPDALTYLEAVPDGYIKDKHKMMEKIKQQQAPVADMAGQMGGLPPGAVMGDVPMAMPEEEAGMPHPNMSMPMDRPLPTDEPPIPTPTGGAMGGVPPMPAEGAQELLPWPEEMPEGGEEGLSPEKMEAIAAELAQLKPEEAGATLEKMQIAQEDKERIWAMVNAIWEARGYEA